MTVSRYHLTLIERIPEVFVNVVVAERGANTGLHFQNPADNFLGG